jgi:hypothetical protein
MGLTLELGRNSLLDDGAVGAAIHWKLCSSNFNRSWSRDSESDLSAFDPDHSEMDIFSDHDLFPRTTSQDQHVSPF